MFRGRITIICCVSEGKETGHQIPKKPFLVAPSHERSDLSGHHSVCRFVCLVGCLLTFWWDTPPPHDPQKTIGSQKFQNQNVFHIILSNFVLGVLPPPPPPRSVEGKLFYRFGFMYVQTTKKKFWKIFFSSNFELKFKFLDHFTELTEASATQIFIDAFSKEFWPF